MDVPVLPSVQQQTARVLLGVLAGAGCGRGPLQGSVLMAVGSPPALGYEI